MPGFPWPVEMRVKWLTDLYGPDNRYLKAVIPWPDHFNGDCSAEASPLYAEELKQFGPFTHVYSSEKYGEPFAKALGAKHVMVDQARTRRPYSGTSIRANLYEHRHDVPFYTYRSMIQKVAFIGGESTGKSTLAERLATEYSTKWVHEYGRELWEAQGGSGSFSDLLKIGVEQYRREEGAIYESDRYLFCDTTALTTEYWCRNYYGVADPRLVDLITRTQDEYIYFVCDNDFPFVDDGLRETMDHAQDFHDGTILDLVHRKLRYWVVTGSVEQRVAQVKFVLDKLS